MRLLFVLILRFTESFVAPKISERVVGGSLTTISHYPNIASLLYLWNLMYTGKLMEVIGPSSEQLRHVLIWTVNQKLFRNPYATWGFLVTNNMFISGWLDVGGRDQYQGDSGDPLYHNNILVGICLRGIQCALPFFPGVNVIVSRFTSWIQVSA